MINNNKDNKNEVADNFINLGIIFNEKGQILLIKRANSEVGKDGSILTWSFPGGRQRLTETRKECVKREILEETGYDVSSTREIAIKLNEQFSVFIVYHLCSLISKKPVQKPSEPYEVAEIKWVKPEEVKNLFTTTIDSKVMKVLRL